jgi:hypothetical protein
LRKSYRYRTIDAWIFKWSSPTQLTDISGVDCAPVALRWE